MLYEKKAKRHHYATKSEKSIPQTPDGTTVARNIDIWKKVAQENQYMYNVEHKNQTTQKIGKPLI